VKDNAKQAQAELQPYTVDYDVETGRWGVLSGHSPYTNSSNYIWAVDSEAAMVEVRRRTTKRCNVCHAPASIGHFKDCRRWG
jgi:hypothetical protein